MRRRRVRRTVVVHQDRAASPVAGPAVAVQPPGGELQSFADALCAAVWNDLARSRPARCYFIVSLWLGDGAFAAMCAPDILGRPRSVRRRNEFRWSWDNFDALDRLLGPGWHVHPLQNDWEALATTSRLDRMPDGSQVRRFYSVPLRVTQHSLPWCPARSSFMAKLRVRRWLRVPPPCCA